MGGGSLALNDVDNNINCQSMRLIGFHRRLPARFPQTDAQLEKPLAIAVQFELYRDAGSPVQLDVEHTLSHNGYYCVSAETERDL